MRNSSFRPNIQLNLIIIMSGCFVNSYLPALLVVLSVILPFRVSWGNIRVQAPQKKWTFGASVRFRYEFQNNFNQLYYGDDPVQGAGNDGFLLGRFRAGLDYRPCKDIHFSLWMQDSEVWDIALADSAFYKGKFGMQNNPNKDRLELWDAFLEIKEIFDLPLSFKCGRQRIFFGNKRIFGPGQWGNTGRWIWDALKFSYKFKHGFVDVYYGRTLLHHPNEFSLDHRHGFESAGIYTHFELPSAFFHTVLEPFFMTKADDHIRYTGEAKIMGDMDSYYWGLRICEEDKKMFDYDVTYIRQGGYFSQDDIDAYGYHLQFAYYFKKMCLKPGISIEYSFASGDSNPYDGDHETFDGAFGARDKMYGRMNLFHFSNLKDVQINLNITPKRWVCLKAEFHKFWLAERKDGWYLNAREYRDKSGASGDEVGRELDFFAIIDLSKNNQFQIGFGHFWPNGFAEKQASHKQSNWVFLQYMYKYSQKSF